MPFQGTTLHTFTSEHQLPGQPSNSSASSVRGDEEEERNLHLPVQYVPVQDATSQIEQQLSFSFFFLCLAGSLLSALQL